MENLNRIELQGNIHESKAFEVGGARLIRFRMQTNHVIKGRNGVVYIEPDFFDVTAWEDTEGVDMDAVEKGRAVHVIGRMKTNRYVDSENEEHISYEVIASKVEEAKDE